MGCNRYSLIRNLLTDGLRLCSVALVLALISVLLSHPVKADSIGLSAGSVDINVASGQLGAGSQQLNVVYNTNAFNGYNVTMSVVGENNALTHGSLNKTIPSLVGATENTPSPLTPNSWGYAIPGRGKFDSGYTSTNVSERSVWASLPEPGSSVIINESGRATDANGVKFDVWFGVRGTNANDIMTAGEYTAKVVYTAVANPVEPPELVSVTPRTYNLGDVTVPARVTITGSRLAALAADGGHVCITPNSSATSCEDATAIPATIVGRPSYSQVVVDLPNSKDKVVEGQKYTILAGVPDDNGGYLYDSLSNIFKYTVMSEVTGISPSSYDLGGDLPIEMVGGAGDTSNSNGLRTQTHQVILTESGQVFTWGANDNGQLGTGDNNDRDTPFNITGRFSSGDDKIIQVSTKGDFNIALTQSGQVYTWGNNYCGQLGNGDAGPCVSDKEHATPDVSKYVNTPINITSQFGLPAGRQIVFVKAGWRQAFAIDSENNLYAWGANYFSQLGLGVTGGPVSKPTIVSFDSVGGINGQIIDLATDSHTLVLTDTGHVYVWGYNYYGQLGNGNNGMASDSNQPIDITDRFNGGKIIQVEASSNGSIVLTEGGEIYAWGENTHGNLGFNEGLTDSLLIHGDIRSEEDHIQPIIPTLASTDDVNGNITELVAGFNKTLAITDGGYAYVWGENSGGHTDTLENAFTYTSEPRLLSASPSKFNLGGDEIMSMVGGQNHSMILTKSGAVFTYGDNTYGQLGTGDTRSIDSPTSITTAFEGKVVQIAALGNHSLALTEDGRIYSWGQNNHGQVGNGRIGDGYDVLSPIDITNSLGLPAGTQVIEVYAAWESSFALTNDGRIFAWGANNQGQLATGDIGDKSLPTEVTFPFDGKMIKLATDSHVLALTDTGHLYSWGYNDHGQADAGQGGDMNILRPIEITDYMQLSDGVEIEAIGAASNASMVLLSDNTSWVWGQNVDGNLGTGGSREQQPLTHVTWLAGNDDITQFATGYYSAIALTESGRVYVWGRNSDGQLGLGHRRNVYTPAELTALRGQANRIYATGNSLFAVDDSGPSYSWGSGSTPEDVSGDVNYRQMIIWGQNLSNATGVYIDLDGDGTIDAGEECGEFTVINSTTLSCVIPVDLDGITPGYYDINVVVRGQTTPLKLAKYFEYYRDTRFVEDNNVIEVNKLFSNLLAVSKLDHEIASSDESVQANKPDAGSDERGGDGLEVESNNNQEPSQASEVTGSPVDDAVSSEITPSINWDGVIKGVNRGQIVIAL